MKKFTIRPMVLASLLATSTLSAWATDGYFSHGYGMKAKGMGGAAVASMDNTFAGANNPATSAWAGNRMEAGVDLFMPDRGMSRVNGAPMDANVSSDSNSFLVPEFGYNKVHNAQISYGVTVYGNGGMNTDYAQNSLGGTGRLGVNLMQLIIAPTLGYKLNDTHSVGVSPLIIVQQFSAEGLDGFSTMSGADTKLTNKGNEKSKGIGVRLGYLGKMNDKLNVGVSYSPKTSMSKFDNYAGLFAEGGGFDIPENYALGFTYQASSQFQIAMDYQRINYSSVAAIGNPSSNQSRLGSASGPGFGWSDVDVFKLGVQWQHSPKLQLRAGYNKSTNPIKSSDVSFNIVAPGVITDHYTLGGTYALEGNKEVSFYYMYAPEQSVKGNSMYNAPPPNGRGLNATETIRMSQQSLGIQFGWKY
jgi:long-chain fatty acid transport protein